jgi:hypothetical protein
MTYTSTIREHTMTVGENFPSTGQGAACGGADTADVAHELAAHAGRFRSLRAA